MWWPLFSDSKRYGNESGFTLTKFIINDMELLEEVLEEHRAKEVKGFGPNSAGRALDTKWNIMSDTFYFWCKLRAPRTGDQAATVKCRILYVWPTWIDQSHNSHSKIDILGSNTSKVVLG